MRLVVCRLFTLNISSLSAPASIRMSWFCGEQQKNGHRLIKVFCGIHRTFQKQLRIFCALHDILLPYFICSLKKSDACRGLSLIPRHRRYLSKSFIFRDGVFFLLRFRLKAVPLNFTLTIPKCNSKWGLGRHQYSWERANSNKNQKTQHKFLSVIIL